MPRWFVEAITAFMVVAFLLVTWVLVEAWKNWRAVKANRKTDASLGSFTRNMFFRQLALFIAQGGLMAMGVIVVAFTTRPPWARVATLWLLAIVALAVGGISFHDWVEMRRQKDDLP